MVGSTKYVSVTFGVLCSKIMGSMYTYPSLSHEVLSPIFQGLSRGGLEPGPLFSLDLPQGQSMGSETQLSQDLPHWDFFRGSSLVL